MVATRNKEYGNVYPMNGQDTYQTASLASPPSDPSPPAIPMKLTIKPPKGVIHKSTFNPCAMVAQNYNIVEDLAQSPLAMLTLKVLQNFPTQKKALILSIICVDPLDSNLVVFSHEIYTPHLPSQFAFII